MPPAAPLAPFPWLDVVIILLLVALNGVFAMAELAIVSSRRPRLRAMAKIGRRGAQTALDLSQDPGRFLSTVQIGITLIGILAGAYSGSSLGGPVGQRLAGLGLDPETARTVGFAVVIILTTYASLVIGELVPKQFALRAPEPIATFLALADAVAVQGDGADRLAARPDQRPHLPAASPAPRIERPCHRRGSASRRRRGDHRGRARGERAGDHFRASSASPTGRPAR